MSGDECEMEEMGVTIGRERRLYGSELRSLCVVAASNVNLPATHAHMLQPDELQAVDSDVLTTHSPRRASLVFHRLQSHFLSNQ